MTYEIRKILQNCTAPSEELDEAIRIRIRLDKSVKVHSAYSTDYNASIKYIESQGYDWIMGNINGHVGGTPYGCVGVTQENASYSATPLLSLWLSYFRLELGDERE